MTKASELMRARARVNVKRWKGKRGEGRGILHGTGRDSLGCRHLFQMSQRGGPHVPCAFPSVSHHLTTIIYIEYEGDGDGEVRVKEEDGG